MHVTARRRDRDDDPQIGRIAAAPATGASKSARLRSRNRLLAILLASVAILGFLVVIMLAVVLRYGQSHLIAGL
ncbi:MAG TPA: hypothetical protein VME41_04880 [Stellaceae bacterium]|nr:hypothetical protein [Stellaceae bacterium]